MLLFIDSKWDNEDLHLKKEVLRHAGFQGLKVYEMYVKQQAAPWMIDRYMDRVSIKMPTQNIGWYGIPKEYLLEHLPKVTLYRLSKTVILLKRQGAEKDITHFVGDLPV